MEESETRGPMEKMFVDRLRRGQQTNGKLRRSARKGVSSSGSCCSLFCARSDLQMFEIARRGDLKKRYFAQKSTLESGPEVQSEWPSRRDEKQRAEQSKTELN